MSMADSAEYQLDNLKESLRRLRDTMLRFMRFNGGNLNDYAQGYMDALSDIGVDMGLLEEPADERFSQDIWIW